MNVYASRMAFEPAVSGRAPPRRRDQQKEQTRLELSLAAFELAKTHGLGNVRVPQIAAAVGVSPRTFNNYFSSKEAAIAWPASLRGVRLGEDLADRPAQEPLGRALVETVVGPYERGGQDGIPAGWLAGFRALVAAEPALHGEYLKAVAVGERALAAAIARRTGAAEADLAPLVLAAMIVAAERAAILHWFRQVTPSVPLAEILRAAVEMAVRGMTGPGLDPAAGPRRSRD